MKFAAAEALLGLGLYRDLSFSGSAYSQVRITAIVVALRSANLSGSLGGSASWETQVMSTSLLLWSNSGSKAMLAE